MDRLKDKVAIVTGSGDGIGKAIALLFAQEGAKVVVTCRREAMGQEVVREIQEKGGTAMYCPLDVSKESSCQDVVNTVIAKWKQIDILVNNAGTVGADKPMHEFQEAEWDKVFAIDVKGVFFMSKHCIPHMMARQQGAIVNMSSIAGVIGADELPAYYAAKGAVTLMTKRDAVAYARYHIRINSVHPGTIMTPLMQDVVRQHPGYLEMDLKRYPMGCFGEPMDVAYAALYLASDEARFVTGAQLAVDGGYTTQ